MVIIMKPTAKAEDIEILVNQLEKQGMKVDINSGTQCKVVAVIGDTQQLNRDSLSIMSGVERILSVQESYKKANRKFHPIDSVINVGNTKIGGKELTIIAGPCSVESTEQMEKTISSVKKSGATLMRGGAYKPRTSPYAFQGLEKEGLEILRHTKNVTGLPIVTEILTPKHVEMFEIMVDVIQIGARNMQNFDLLKEVGRTNKPVLLKRGLSATISEWLMSAEYIMAMGNNNVILCERGIRTFETYTRNTLDLSAIPVVKQLSHLPIIIDPSHATGIASLVPSMAMAAVAAGADGILVEVHNDPKNALCDGAQSLTCDEFEKLTKKLRDLCPLVGRTFPRTGALSEVETKKA